jgi:hypothetical protein
LAQLASPIFAELFVVNRRFLSQFRVPGETKMIKLAPTAWMCCGAAHVIAMKEHRSVPPDFKNAPS